MAYIKRNVPDWIDGYMDLTEGTEPPVSYRKWMAVSTIAACLRRKCYLKIGFLTFFPNMYIVLVGPTGVRKGTAMTPGYELLRSRGIKLAAESITREALIKELRESTDNTTDEEGNPILHCSLTVFSPELTVFLGYSSLQLMSDLADWFDCRDLWIYRTKGSGTEEITNLWVNLIGATTPELLRSTLPKDAIGGGLTGRMIFVFETKKGLSIHSLFHQKNRYIYGVSSQKILRQSL